MHDPMEAITRLRNALAEEAQAIGLELKAFRVAPPQPDGPDVPFVEAVFAISEDAFLTDGDLEKARIDAELKQMEMGMAMDQRQANAQKAIADLRRTAAGIFDDDEEGDESG